MSALAQVSEVLCCPVCEGSLQQHEPQQGPSGLVCVAGHRFDIARQGHVVLVPGGTKLRADTADMVAARTRVLAGGAFDDVTAALVAEVSGRSEGLVVDLGAGTGHYTAAVLDALPEHRGLALDLSVPALRVAARAHQRLAAVGADLTRALPLVDGALKEQGVLLAVFAPLPTDAELRRTSSPGTRLVVVTPTPVHLAELRGRLRLLDVPAGKADSLRRRLDPTWQVVDEVTTTRHVELTQQDAADVVAMGPNAWHTDDRLRAALVQLPTALTDTVEVTVSAFERD